MYKQFENSCIEKQVTKLLIIKNKLNNEMKLVKLTKLKIRAEKISIVSICHLETLLKTRVFITEVNYENHFCHLNEK